MLVLVEGRVYFYQGGVIPGKNESRLVDLSHWDCRISQLAFYMIHIGDFVLVFGLLHDTYRGFGASFWQDGVIFQPKPSTSIWEVSEPAE